MKTYLRILTYAKPYGKYLPRYIFFATLAIIFGLLNYALLKPLFDVVFEQVDLEQIAKYKEPIEFSLSLDYFMHTFNHFLVKASETQGKMGTLKYVCAVIVFSVLLANVFTYVSNVLLAKIRAKVIEKLRMDIFDKASELHLGYFTNERKGDLMSRITNDVQEVENTIVSTLKVAFREPATILITFVLLFAISAKLTFFTILFLPVTGYLISAITVRLKKKATQSQESLGRIVNILEETLSGIRVIKAFSARNYISQVFGREVAEYSGINISMARKNELAPPLSQFLGVVVVAGILLYGGNLVLNQESDLSASAFFTYIILFTQVLNPSKAISQAISNIQRGIASGDRIFAIIDTPPAITDPEPAKVMNDFEQGIEFKDVWFSYDKEWVLKGLNLRIEKGKSVALVGPSGGGKSTIADLVPRFYDPTKGAVWIDGEDIRSYKIADLRKHMGIVTQESILFNDTVFKNIAFGKPDANKEDVIKAAKIANAHAFIEQLENGYDTMIGERGTRLSGGQRQRLSIARAVFKNPSILILDEATSALDSESEKLVQDALFNLMKNRTSLVIAHRLSTIQHADEIIVVEKGEIIERGSHSELIERDGLYKKLSQIQQS
ncbi:ABC transporter ATP-binding protein [Peijinzhouia sedimentorum]